MQQQEKVFANGFIIKERNPNCPEWVVGNVSIKVDEFIQTLQQYNKNGWVNITIKKSQGGKTYAEIDTWEPQQRQPQVPPPQQQAYQPPPQQPQQPPQYPQTQSYGGHTVQADALQGLDNTQPPF